MTGIADCGDAEGQVRVCGGALRVSHYSLELLLLVAHESVKASNDLLLGRRPIRIFTDVEIEL